MNVSSRHKAIACLAIPAQKNCINVRTQSLSNSDMCTSSRKTLTVYKLCISNFIYILKVAFKQLMFKKNKVLNLYP